MPRLRTLLHCLLLTAVVVGTGLWLARQAMAQTGGVFIYALDDPYIHMAVARNFAQTGVWGINPGEFASCSSSPLWTLLLAGCYKVFGVHDMTAFVLALASAAGATVVAYLMLRRLGVKDWLAFAGSLTMAVLAPLTMLPMTGMEHPLHTLLSIVFMGLAIKYLQQAEDRRLKAEGTATTTERQATEAKPFARPLPWLIALAPLLVMARYEGLFLVAAVCLVLLLRRRIAACFALGAAAFAPVVIYGLISMSQGWGFLPNSVALKGTSFRWATASEVVMSLGGLALQRLFLTPHLLVLAIGVPVVYYLAGKACRQRTAAGVAVFMITLMLHLRFAAVGWLFRYEAYLMAIGVFVGIVCLSRVFEGKVSRQRALAVLVAAATMVLPVLHASDAHTRAVGASRNIHDQQYQMGLFLKKYYPGATVAANDIGAVTYFGNIRCVDLLGLANNCVGRHIVANTYDKEAIEQIITREKPQIMVVYEDWLAVYGLPDNRIFAGSWQIPNNVVCGRDTVSFFAFDTRQWERLRANLKDFKASLPADVVTAP